MRTLRTWAEFIDDSWENKPQAQLPLTETGGLWYTNSLAQGNSADLLIFLTETA